MTEPYKPHDPNSWTDARRDQTIEQADAEVDRWDEPLTVPKEQPCGGS